MKNTHVILGSIFAATLIIGTASAAYLYSDYPSSTRSSGLMVPVTSTNEGAVATTPKERSLLPAELTVHETMRISDEVQIVSATSPLTDDGVFESTFSLWRLDDKQQKAEKIYEYTSGIPVGIVTTIERGYSRNEYIYTLEEAWEGYRHIERITLASDGSIATHIIQPSAIEFTLKSKGHSITVKPLGDTCYGRETQEETSQSSIRSLIVNQEGYLLNTPYTLNCDLNQIAGVQTGTMFTDIDISQPDTNGNRNAYVNLYGSTQTLELTINKEGLVNIKQ